MIGYSQEYLDANEPKHGIEPDSWLYKNEDLVKIYKQHGPGSEEVDRAIRVWTGDRQIELMMSNTKYEDLWLALETIILYLDLGIIETAQNIYKQLVDAMGEIPDLEDETLKGKEMSLIKTYDLVSARLDRALDGLE